MRPTTLQRATGRRNRGPSAPSLASTLVGLLLALGCVRTTTNAHWPKPIAVSNVRDFEGLYANGSIDPKTNQTSDRSAQLFDFVTNRGHEHGTRGTQVEIQVSEDGSILHVRLLDSASTEIDKADLKRTTDFEFSRGHLDIQGPFVGRHSDASNLAASTETRSSRLFVSETGALLGKRSSSGAGLLFYFIPAAGSRTDWMLWEKLPSAGDR